MWKEKIFQSGLNPSEVRLLFFAKFAPEKNSPQPEMDSVYGISPRYHHEIYTMLRELGFDPISACQHEVLFEHRGEIDYVFSLYNQAPFRSSEVFVASVCEFFRVPYLGAPPHIRALAQDKHLGKIFARHLGIPTPPWALFRSDGDVVRPPTFPGPYIAKPRSAAASKAIHEESVQDEWKPLQPSIAEMISKGWDVIVEQFIPGDNITVPVIGGIPPLVLPPIVALSTKKGGIVTNEQKRSLEDGLQRKQFHRSDLDSHLKGYSLRLYMAAQPLDYTRIDFRLDPCSRRPMFLEFNVCCNLGSHSSIALAAKCAGYEHIELLAMILHHSFRRQGLLG